MHVQALSESGCLANGSKPTALAHLPSDDRDPWRTGLIVHRKSKLQPPACVWLDPDSSPLHSDDEGAPAAAVRQPDATTNALKPGRSGARQSRKESLRVSVDEEGGRGGGDVGVDVSVVAMGQETAPGAAGTPSACRREHSFYTSAADPHAQVSSVTRLECLL